MRAFGSFIIAGYLLAFSVVAPSSAQTTAIAVDFGGDYDGGGGSTNSPLKATAATDIGDFNQDAITDARTYIPIDSSAYFLQLDNAYPPGLAGKSNKINAGAQIVDYSTTSPPGINLFRYANSDALQLSNSAGTSTMGMAFAPHVRKADFLNGLNSATSLTFADQASGFSLDWAFEAAPNATGIRRARLLVQEGSDWYISETTSGAKDSDFTLNPYSELWYPFDPSTSLFYDEVGGGDTTPMGIGVAGSTFADIQAIGAHLMNTNFNGSSANAGNMRVTGFSAASAGTLPTSYSPMRIVDSAETHALWRMESIDPNVSVNDVIFNKTFTSDAIRDDDSSFPRADYQDLLLGPTFANFPVAKRPTLTTGGGGILGEALSFDASQQQEAIAILGWLGDGDDGTGIVDPNNSLDTVYTDFWFREADHDGTQVMLSATSTWEVRLSGDQVAFTVWDSNFGNNTISVDLDVFGAEGEPNARWRHAVAFVDETSLMSLTIDDVTVTGTLNGPIKPQKKSITLGNKENQARWFNGLIDEVYIGFGPPTYALPGDFDGDGDVDGSDFLAWQRDPTIGNLADWEANYGSAVSPAVSSVPEPSALCLVLMLSLGALSRKR